MILFKHITRMTPLFLAASLFVSVTVAAPGTAKVDAEAKADAKSEVTVEDSNQKKEAKPQSEKTPEELEAEQQRAEQALKEAEADLKHAENRRKEAVANLKATGSDRDWAMGVSEADQRRANELLQEGNVLLKESFFAQAVDKYEESLKLWDHPGTHYNLALAMLTLDDPLTTHGHLTKAVKHGPDPLEQDKFDYALNYLALLDKQVATVVIDCEEPGAEVRLDGRFLFRAPGREEILVLRGEHSMTAKKPGFETKQITKRIDSDQKVKVSLKLYRPDELYVYSRPYPLWIPITVTTLGAVMVGGAVGANFLAQSEYDKYDQSILEDGTCDAGCVPDGTPADEKAAGDKMKLISTIGFIAGGAVMATGITLWALDSRNSTRVTPEDKQKLEVSPLFGPGFGGVMATGQF